jgi:hypothetical protein
MNEKCQVFTPENYVEELLDSIGYTQQLHGKKILENSCGDGNILMILKVLGLLPRVTYRTNMIVRKL